MKKMKKLLALLLCLVLVLGATVSGSLAFLIAKTDSITNTFTLGDFTYSLTLHGNKPTTDGDVTMPTLTPNSPQVVAAGSATFTTSGAPTLVGYLFGGWHYDSDGNEPYADYSGNDITVGYGDEHDKDPAADKIEIELFAKWKPITYRIIYNGNGATAGEMQPSTHTYDVESNLSENQYTRTGYAFLGWSTDENATEPDYQDKASIKNLTTEDGEEIELFAVWKKMDFTLTFDPNAVGATANPTSKTVTYGLPYGELATATRPGYAFTGWSLTQDGTQIIKDTDTVNVADDHIVYAQWRANNYTVKYNANGGTGTMEDQVFEYGEKDFLRKNTFTKEGYEFAGWALNPDDQTPKYADHDFVSNLTTESEITLYAVWSADQIVVTFDSQYAEVQPSPRTKLVTFNEAYGALPTVAIEGYRFLGWYTAKSGGELITAESTVNIPNNHTLYAHWETPQIDLLMMFEGSGTNKFETFAKHDYEFNKAITYTGQTIQGQWESFCIRMSNLVVGGTYRLTFDAAFSDRTCIRSYNYSDERNDQKAKTYPIGCRVEETSSFAESGSTREYTWEPTDKNKSTEGFVIEFVATKEAMFWQWELSKIRNPGETYYGTGNNNYNKTWKAGMDNFEESYFDLMLNNITLELIPPYIDFEEIKANTTNKEGESVGKFTRNSYSANSVDFNYTGAAGLYEKVRIPINGLLVGHTYTVHYTMSTTANSSKFDQAIGTSKTLSNTYDYESNKVVFTQTVDKSVEGSFSFKATDTTMYWIWGMTGISNGKNYNFKINATIKLDDSATPTVLSIAEDSTVELPEGVTMGEEIVLTEMPDMAQLEASVAVENMDLYGWMVEGFFGSEIYLAEEMEEVLAGVFADAAEYGDEVELHLTPLYTESDGESVEAATDPALPPKEEDNLMPDEEVAEE